MDQPGGVSTVTFPAQWVHTEDDGGDPGSATSPPWVGANGDELEFVVDGALAEEGDVLASIPEVAPF